MLDCSTVDTALHSLADLLGRRAPTLKARLEELGPSQLESDELPPEEVLERSILGETEPEPESVVYFHATRVPASINFDDGLLPSSTRRSPIENYLKGLAIGTGLCTESQWGQLSRTGIGSSQTATKIAAGSADDGPHAFLIRDAIVRRRALGLSDFLATPEAVADLCASFQDPLGAHLLNAYKEATIPKVVAFRVPGPRWGAVQGALAYVHQEVRSEDVWPLGAWGYNGQGTPVSVDQIISVQSSPPDV